MQSRGTTFISWIELALDTNWTEVPLGEWGNYHDTKRMATFLGAGWMLFRAEHSAEIEVLEPEVIRRRMQFRPKAMIAVGNQVLRYEDADYESELRIDEAKQTAERKR